MRIRGAGGGGIEPGGTEDAERARGPDRSDRPGETEPDAGTLVEDSRPPVDPSTISEHPVEQQSAFSSDLERRLAADPGYGRGELTAEEQAQVRTGEARARQVADRPIRWDNPERSLQDIRQVDADQNTRYDTDRCGAASIVAGNVLMGPDSCNAATGRLRGRLDQLERNLDRQPEGTRETQRAELARARELLDSASPPQRGAYAWTAADAQRFQEAVYVTARIDEEQTVVAERLERNERMGIPADNVRMDTGVSGHTVHRYRDLLWGSGPGADGRPRLNQPEHGGRPVDVYHAPEGHFVLGEGSARAEDVRRQAQVVYDPWPGAQARTARVDGDADHWSRLDRMSDEERTRVANDSRHDG